MDTALVSIEEAAKMLGLSKFTLRRWTAQRRVPYVRLGRRIVFDPRALASFVTANTVGASDGNGLRHGLQGTRELTGR
jgi:excisionase family DNA binding protein